MIKRNIVPDSGGTPQAAAVKPPHPLVGGEFVIAAAAAAQLPEPSVPEIAFAGRSNAGKSSAINVLAGRTRLAFASRTPGRTQQIVFFRLRSGALVADLPGYGYAAVAKAIKQSWQDFLWSYVTTRSTLAALVLVVDSRHGLRPLDLELLGGFLPSGRPVLVLATKADKLNTTEKRAAVAGITRELAAAFPVHGPAVSVVLFSATAHLGVTTAETIIESWVSGV